MEYYRSQGYIIDEVEKTGRFRKHKDLFSEYLLEAGFNAGFDAIAIKPKEAILIQITTTRPKVHKPFHWFKDRFPDIGVEQFIRTDRNKDNVRIVYLSDEIRGTTKV